jgi:phosphoserine phosphatase RsbU/P
MEANDDDGDRGHILLVDDDQALGSYLARALRSGGYDVAYELSSEVTLCRIQGEQWDLLITDIELPGMSGLELLERVRETSPALPVALLTGHPSVDYAVTARCWAATDFLTKPVSRDELLAKAAELIAAGRAARGQD